jgi:hypothetical protein
VLNQSPEKIVQSFEMGGSLGYKLVGPIKGPGGLATINLIGGGGMITPLSPAQANPPTFVATSETQTYYQSMPVNTTLNLSDQFNTANCKSVDASNPKCFVVVYPADRLQFFRYYAGGLRIKFYRMDNSKDDNGQLHGGYQFPGNFDITFGQNEYVTGGKLHGIVLHAGGTFPIADYLYLTFGMDTSLTKNSTPTLPLLTLAGSNPASDATVVKVRQSQFNRDRYTVGLGFDLAHFLKENLGKKETANNAAAGGGNPSAPGSPGVSSGNNK